MFEKKLKVGLIFCVMMVVAIGFIPVAHASPYTVEIRISGTPGLAFSGAYGDLGSSKSVEGRIPAGGVGSYFIKDPEGNIVSAVFQKQTETGTLTVTFLKDGKEVKSESTSAAYGVVSLSHDFSGCFIATAAYGSPTAEKLNILRDFRDNVLEKNEVGRMAVSFYYEVSPPIADFISENYILRVFVRDAIIDPMVDFLEVTRNVWD